VVSFFHQQSHNAQVTSAHRKVQCRLGCAENRGSTLFKRTCVTLRVPVGKSVEVAHDVDLASLGRNIVGPLVSLL